MHPLPTAPAQRTPPPTRLFFSFISALLVFALTAPSALAQMSPPQPWELRVCADPGAYPASSRDRPGFDNRIAGILADAMGAEPTFVWARANSAAVRDLLRPGQCDLLMSVSEGAENLSTSVAYYRTPYVFLSLAERDLDIRALDDPALAELRIGTYPASVPETALDGAGLRDNVVRQRPVVGTNDRTDRVTPMLDALRADEIDIAVLYGPDASVAVQSEPGVWTLEPVTPEITLSGLQMFRIWTIGVRPGDEALRDRLNIALAERWDEIQAVFDAYGIPLQSLPQPRTSTPPDPEPVRIGVVLPLPSGVQVATDTIADAAQIGAETADDLIGRSAGAADLPIRVYYANAPDAAAAVRAAERLIATERVDALVGGIGEGQARALAEVAAARGTLFLNVGSPDDALRAGACGGPTFHVEASAAMYLDALIGWNADAGRRSWFLVYEESDAGRALRDRASDAIAALGEGAVTGEAALPAGPAPYRDTFGEIGAAAPDAVLVLLAPSEQELFLAQYAFEGLRPAITGFPHPLMQARDFLLRLRQVAPQAGPRVALWDAALEPDGAGELNQRFSSRSGAPMDPSGWAAYAAVQIAYDAVSATGSRALETLIAHLEAADTDFDLAKEVPLSFRPWSHQLRQPLYLIETDPAASWGAAVSARIAIARALGPLPDLYAPDGDLDLLGVGPDEASCP